MQGSEIYFNFWVSVSFATIVSPASKKSFRKPITGTCRSVIRKLRDYQKAQFVLNFLHDASTFPTKIENSNSSSTSQSEASYFSQEYFIKKSVVLGPSSKSWLSEISKKKPSLSIFKYSPSNCLFDFFYQIGNDKHHTCWWGFDFQTIRSRPCVKFLTVQKSKEKLLN